MSENIEEKLAQIQDVSAVEKESREPGLELAENESTEGLVDAIDKIARKEEADEPIIVQDLLDLERSLKEMKIDFGDESFTPEEIKNDPTIKKNILLWREIKKGHSFQITQLTRINPEILREILEMEKGEEVALYNLAVISDECAKLLVGHKGYISLSSVTEISDEALECLSQHDGGLSLDRLVSLSDRGALALSKVHQVVVLRSLRNISDQGCMYLARMDPDDLNLPYGTNTEINDRVRRYRSKWTTVKSKLKRAKRYFKEGY